MDGVSSLFGISIPARKTFDPLYCWISFEPTPSMHFHSRTKKANLRKYFQNNIKRKWQSFVHHIDVKYLYNESAVHSYKHVIINENLMDCSRRIVLAWFSAPTYPMCVYICVLLAHLAAPRCYNFLLSRHQLNYITIKWNGFVLIHYKVLIVLNAWMRWM